MIEISHKQAQHLIREGQDRRLPEEQWAVLYAHLEDCPECRAYRQRLTTYEKDLARLLRTRWGAARGPGAGVDKRVIGHRERRKKLRKFLGRASLYGLGLLLLVGYIAYRRVTAPPPVPTPVAEFSARPVQTGTPPYQGVFRGLVAFETHRDGDAEIYVLNASADGTHVTNLTKDPAQDTAPVWSPDGEWIAFLSNRTGKNEVFITHIAGSRLTQVTNAPQIEWRGPLAWSFDGKWLGLTGVRGGAELSSFLYLVPVNGASEPRSIANTYHAANWLRFSPDQPALAFQTAYRTGGLDIVNTDTGWINPITLEDNQDLHLSTGQAGAFDWSLGGDNLAYASVPQYAIDRTGKNEAQIRLSPIIQIDEHRQYYTAGAQAVDSVPAPNHFRAVSWVPHSLIVAGLVEDEKVEGKDPCWVIRLTNAYNSTQSTRIINGLCVTGGLEQANWTADGSWLVVVARRPDETASSLYAMRLPEMVGRENTSRDGVLSTNSTYFERLAEVPGVDLPPVIGFVPEGAFSTEPRVRPGGRFLSITPKTALPAAPTPAPLAPPSGLSGWIAYNIRQGEDSWIMRSRPDGSEGLLLTTKSGEHTCPRISPDGKTVAFLSDQASNKPGVNEVYLVGVDGKDPVQRTNHAFPVTEIPGSTAVHLPRYDCPVWSSDGKYLAAVHRTAEEVYLAVIPIDENSPARYLQLETISDLAAPVWLPKDASSPDSGAGQILLAYPRYGLPARLVTVNVDASQDRQPAVVENDFQITDWDDIQWLALSPDGQNLAMVLVYENLPSDPFPKGRTYAELRVINRATFQLVAKINLPRYDPVTNNYGGLSWLPDGKIVLARIDGLIGPGKTVFERFDPFSGRNQVRLEQMARFEDLTYQATWMQNRWVVFTAESGLWLVNLEDAQANRSSPVLLSPEPVSDLDWR